MIMCGGETARALQDLAVKYSLALGFGLLTVENRGQAEERASVDPPQQRRRSRARLLEHDRNEADLRALSPVTNVDPDGPDDAAPQANVARSVARLNAVQALYQMAISGGTADGVIREFAVEPNGRLDEDNDEPIAEADKSLFAELVRGTRSQLTEVDKMLSACLDDAWPAERMEILLRTILRCGAFELYSQPSVPARVVISEYVRVADAFFEGKEPALVNAILDRLTRVLRPEELTERDSRR